MDGIWPEEQIKTPREGSAPGSPVNKVKFLCSYGGKILPRPADNHLKYVGGETRVISVPRDISFSQLMKKLTYLIEGEMVLKYQLIPEELDALVSVKSDEDLKHMFDEYDRHANDGTPRLRAFLFPANPTVIENQSMEPQAIEQRYIDAINGIVRGPPPHKPTAINTSRPTFTITSPCSSPRSPPESCLTETFTRRHPMHKVHSSPSISNLSVQGQNLANHQQSLHHQQHCYQSFRQPPPPLLAPQHHHHHHQQQQYPPQSYQPMKPPLDPQRNIVPERLTKMRSVGRAEPSRYHMDNVQNHYYSTSRHNKGIGSCSRCINYDDYGGYGDGRIDRTESLPSSPLSHSPRHGYYGVKPWDSAM